jgi:hypothetical protein
MKATAIDAVYGKLGDFTYLEQDLPLARMVCAHKINH